MFRARGCIVNKEGSVIGYYPSSPIRESSEDYMYHVFGGYRHQTISEFFYRTHHIKTQGGFVHFPLAWHADYCTVFSLSRIGGIASSSKPLVLFRMSGDNISSKFSSNGIKKAEANYLAYNYAREIINSSDSILKPLLNKRLPSWKYAEDRYVAQTISLFDFFSLVMVMKKYKIKLRSIVIGFLSHFI